MDLALDAATGDLAVDPATKDLQVADGNDAVLQELRILLRQLKGEWFLDERVGVPYLQQIFGKGRSPQVLRSIFRKALLTASRVRSVAELTLSLDSATRTLTVAARCVLDDGAALTLDFSEVII